MNTTHGHPHASRGRFALAALLALAASARGAALDSVNVTASIPVAYEAGPVTGCFTITRSGSTGSLTVSFTLGGTAVEGSRYVTVSPHAVTFADGDVSKTVTITPIDDTVTEGAQFVTLTLSTDPTYIVGASSSGQVIIADNDMTLSLSVPDPTADEDTALFGDALDPNERRRGVMRATFTSATSTTAIKKALSVNVSGAATLGTDYALFYKVGSNALTHFGSSLGDVSSGSGYQVVGAGAIGQQTFTVGSGSGGIFIDDIVQFTGDSNYYRVTASNVGAGSIGGSITVYRFITAGTSTGFPGTEVAVADKAAVVTSFPITTSQQNILLHDNDTKVEFSVEPVHNGIAEGALNVVLTLLGNNDYALVNPTVGTVTIADRDSVANVSLGANAGKPSTAGNFLVTFSKAFTKPITVPYTITGTAVAGTDYIALPGSITVPAGQTSVQIPVTPLNTPANGIKTVTLTLDSTLDYQLAGSGSSSTNPSATLNITDAIGTIGIAATTAIAVESPAPTPGLLTVTLVRNLNGGLPVPGAVTVNYVVTGSAVAGTRYTSLPGTVTIPNGSTSATITVTPIDDLVYEGTQSVVVTLGAGQGYAINGSSNFAQVNINDDEPTISIARAADATRPSTSGSFVVSYPGVPAGTALNRAVVVPLTYSGTAVAGTDYTAPAIVTIPAGSRSATVVVSPVTSTTTAAVTLTATVASNTGYGITTGSASLQINPVGATTTQQQNLKPDVGSVSTSKSGGCGRGSGLFLATAVLALNLAPMRRRRRR